MRVSPCVVVMLAGVALVVGAGVMLMTASSLRSSPARAPRAVVIPPAPMGPAPIATESVSLRVRPSRGGHAV